MTSIDLLTLGLVVFVAGFFFLLGRASRNAELKKSHFALGCYAKYTGLLAGDVVDILTERGVNGHLK